MTAENRWFTHMRAKLVPKHDEWTVDLFMAGVTSALMRQRMEATLHGETLCREAEIQIFVDYFKVIPSESHPDVELFREFIEILAEIEGEGAVFAAML